MGIANIIVVLNLNCSLLFRCEHGDIWYTLELILFCCEHGGFWYIHVLEQLPVVLLWTWYMVHVSFGMYLKCFVVTLWTWWFFWYLLELLHCLFANTACIHYVYLNCYLLILCEHSNTLYMVLELVYVALLWTLKKLLTAQLLNVQWYWVPSIKRSKILNSWE